MLPITDLLKQIKQIATIDTKENVRFANDLIKPVVVWNVNEYCNMSCPHCYASAKVIKKNAQELPTEQAETILKQLYQYGIKVLIFSGGGTITTQRSIPFNRISIKFRISMSFINKWSFN